jgi:hypothetical protein
MKKLLFILCLITSNISHAQNNLPPCNGNFIGPCFAVYIYPEGDKNAGDKYVGEIKDNKWNGQGVFTFTNGSKYTGQWKDGMYDGQGTFTYANGDKYVGQFKDNKKNGQGTFTFANGNKYVGQFQDDKYGGFGTFYNANGSINQQGLWRDNKFVQAQTHPTVTPPVVPPVIPKPPVNNAQDIKRQKCIRLGLAPGSADFQQCIN